MKKFLSVFLTLLLLLPLMSVSAFAQEDVRIEFIQWWEPELPQGFFRGLMDEFEAQNPGIKVDLISGPYSSTKDQIIAGAATGTLCDVVGLDGAWVNDLSKQGAIANLDDLVATYKTDDSEFGAKVAVGGKDYMYGVVTFAYTMFVNNDMLKAAGIEAAPTNRTEFAAAAQALTNADKNQYGWVLPLSLQSPNGIQNDTMSWVWASGGSMMNKDGTPNVNNPDVKEALVFIKDLYDKGVISPGSFAKQEQDKVEEFVNGRIGTMVDTLAHITMIRERNPELNFSVSAVPAKDGYDGKRGMVYAAWGIGVSETSQHKEEAWKLVNFLLSSDVNARLAATANAFPGNSKATPDYSKADELFVKAFEIYQQSYACNEFVGLPVAEDLMRMFAEQFQGALEGNQSIDDCLAKVQEKWQAEFK